jgi:hypothetical protein
VIPHSGQTALPLALSTFFPMPLSSDETKQLLERLVFIDGTAEDWVQDVWALSPTLGETAARLVDILDGLLDCTSEERLEALLQNFYREQLEE